MVLSSTRANRLFVPLSIGSIGLGLVGLVFRDFALQWQPVPTNLPFYKPIAIISAVFLIGAGVFLWPTRIRPRAAVVLAIYFALWTLILQLPRAVAAPTNVAMWLGVAEIGALAAGAFAVVGEAWHSRTTLLAARVALGVCAIVFGLSHFVYIDFTAGMIPKWIPGPVGWAYATGAGHLLAGLSLASGIQSRVAALALSAMCGSFVLLLHIPGALSAPDSHAQWTGVFIALSIAGAALATAAAPQARDKEQPGADAQASRARLRRSNSMKLS
ncbi:DoxX family protein [Sphingomonas antarctica]|uniref:DoxX family protein n=1 Tax=Sphingomonas antarctica TaxID=2040274 RepID=UPI0039EAA768